MNYIQKVRLKVILGVHDEEKQVLKFDKVVHKSEYSSTKIEHPMENIPAITFYITEIDEFRLHCDYIDKQNCEW